MVVGRRERIEAAHLLDDGERGLWVLGCGQDGCLEDQALEKGRVFGDCFTHYYLLWFRPGRHPQVRFSSLVSQDGQ